MTTTQMAERAGLSRTTLGAIEAGEPAPTMGSYLRVMSVLGVAKDLVLLASDTLDAPVENDSTTPVSARLVVSAGMPTTSFKTSRA